jgi:cyclopropane fatty-acyl-phospholipid synthase-like methyltransferase
LGCGVGREAIYLAKKGFEVIGVDFSPTAIQRARRRAKSEEVDIQFVVDDLTNLQHISGTYNLVMDFGALNDLNQKGRDLYMQNILPLFGPSSKYVMFCFDRMLPPDEITRRFGDPFNIEILHKTTESRFPGVMTLYWMIMKK